MRLGNRKKFIGILSAIVIPFVFYSVIHTAYAETDNPSVEIKIDESFKYKNISFSIYSDNKNIANITDFAIHHTGEKPILHANFTKKQAIQINHDTRILAFVAEKNNSPYMSKYQMYVSKSRFSKKQGCTVLDFPEMFITSKGKAYL
jgi:uncharacterized protein with PQ loop repeat